MVAVLKLQQMKLRQIILMHNVGAQLGLYGQYINFLAGDDYTQIDFTGGFNITEDLFLGINATYNRSCCRCRFSGIALYPQYTISDSFSIGLRGEIFS